MIASDKSPSREQSAPPRFRKLGRMFTVSGGQGHLDPVVLRAVAKLARTCFPEGLFGSTRNEIGRDLCDAVLDAADSLTEAKAERDAAEAALRDAGWDLRRRGSQDADTWLPPPSPDPAWLDSIIAQRDRAERALQRAGYTYKDGAAEWRPPVGPSARPVLDAVDEASEAIGQLSGALEILKARALSRSASPVPPSDGTAGALVTAEAVAYAESTWGVAWANSEARHLWEFVRLCDPDTASNRGGDGFVLFADVSKVEGDYCFDGDVRGIVWKRSGQVRYVVEDDRGVLFIFKGEQLAPAVP